MELLEAELKEVLMLQALLADPRARISSQAITDLQGCLESSYAVVRFAAACATSKDGELWRYVDEELLPYLVMKARAVREGKKTQDEVLALVRDVGELFKVSRSPKVWGVLAAIAGTTSDEDVREEAERYALDGYFRKY